MPRWDTAIHTRQPILDTEVGRYLIKHEGRKNYRAYLNGTRTEYRGNSEQQVKEMVDRFLRSYEMEKKDV